MFLTRVDVERLTGKRRFSAQRRALAAMGVRYTESATGEPLVRMEALDSRKRTREPRWERISG